METGSKTADNQAGSHRSRNETGMWFRISRCVARFISLFPIRLVPEIGHWKLETRNWGPTGQTVGARPSLRVAQDKLWPWSATGGAPVPRAGARLNSGRRSAIMEMSGMNFFGEEAL